MFARIRHAYATVVDDIEEEWRRMVTPDPPPAADPPGTEAPIRMDPDSAVLESGRLDRSVPVVSLRGIVKQSMTKKVPDGPVNADARDVSALRLAGDHTQPGYG